MLDLSYILGFVGMAVGLIIGILIFSAVEDSINCPDPIVHPDGSESCERASQIAWTVIGILPISMFFAIFTIFGGMNKFTLE
jgi:ABC-type lipoprotein release transport system permease subunit